MHLRFTSEVIDKVQLNPKLYKLVLKSPSPKFEFEAGQYMSIAVEGAIRRSYSFANPPHENGSLVTYIDTTPAGPGSQFCERVEVGESVDVLAPLGHFYYIPDRKPVYFFATGTGIVPFLSMIRHELEEIKSNREVNLYFGVRYQSGLIELDLLNKLVQTYPNFHLNLYVSQDSEWEGNKGRITHGLGEMNQDDIDAYLCGGYEMITDIEQSLLLKGVPEEQIYFERFY